MSGMLYGMTRIRTISPDIYESESMASITGDQERTLHRLSMYCDDEGRCRYNPKLIKAAIYPLHDDVDADVVDKNVMGLVDAALVAICSEGCERYLQILEWNQHPQKPKPSQHPALSDVDGES